MRTRSSHLVVAFLAGSVLLAACGKGGDSGDATSAATGADAEKKAHETAIADLKQPIAIISGYSPYARYPEPLDKYFPARHPDYEKSTLMAANEMRYAANKARQKLEASSASATKDLQGALRDLTNACAEADDQDKLAKCAGAVKALDGALDKANQAASALGVTAKYPRIAPESVTDEARTAMATYLKARGPGDNEKAFIAKRSDPSVTPAALSAACQTAQADAVTAAQTYEKADESIRLVAATRKMSMDSQCRRIGELEALSKDLAGCRKKAKSADCKVVCGKVKNWIDDGFPGAAFASVTKDNDEICKN